MDQKKTIGSPNSSFSKYQANKEGVEGFQIFKRKVLEVKCDLSAVWPDNEKLHYQHQFCNLKIIYQHISQENQEDFLQHFKSIAQQCQKTNEDLQQDLKKLQEEKNQLQAKIYDLEIKNNSNIDHENSNKKRKRKQANQIERHYQCHIQSCLKSYGSEGSLQQHIRIKHPDVYNNSSSNQSLLNQKFSDQIDHNDHIYPQPQILKVSIPVTI